MIKNCLAKQFDNEGKKLHVYNANGLWMLIDNSFNLHETETVKVNEAVSDNEGIQAYFNSHKNTNFKITPEFVLEVMNGIQQNQLIFDKNMKSHIMAIQKLGVGADNLSKKVDELSKVIKELKNVEEKKQ